MNNPSQPKPFASSTYRVVLFIHRTSIEKEKLQNFQRYFLLTWEFWAKQHTKLGASQPRIHWLLFQVVRGTQFRYQEWRQCWGFHSEWNSLNSPLIPQLISTHLAPPSSRRLQQYDIQWTGPEQSPVASFKLFCF